MNRRVLVTGASKGIGRAIALQLAKDGFHVVVHFGGDFKGAEQTLESIVNAGGSGEVLQFDLTEREQIAKILEAQIEQHGAYYGIVCNAGVCDDAAFPAMDGEIWDRVVHTNLDGLFNVLHPCIMPMVRSRKGGRIVTLSSVSGVIGNRGQVNYSASKAGIIGATKSLALELASRKITVNCVAPGLIETGMVEQEVIDHAMKMIPSKRMGQPEEVAATVAFLMSDSAAYITRQVISVNGGLA
ncbi:3-oxoacyl-ACP reductase FabG [Corallincola platygyrae]|uniref:3-oxoacyl-ACP reductase FabG n=1 Tax=Corallincola platygyrae TaxID=1193278 RepID=A0ABW4XHU4_9GAMM